ncbi:AMP-binding protein [Sphingoaurantiacus capsulatus]|uniref:AMP-binding protein n=1 Tax=Sphingoaurantiacus capsulatus TaxID=1771310 RepID=A0ABV7XCH5_9SPHN
MAENWSFGRVFSKVAAGVPADAPALIHGDRVIRWGELEKRSNALAGAFIAAGAAPGDKIAHLMRNSPAYLETTIAGFKSRLVHVNVNYRYTGEELHYILDNSDSAVVVFDAEFAEVLGGIRHRLPLVKLWVQVGGETADFAVDYEATAEGDATPPALDYQPSDMMFIYTGGTTGMPKGVMWDQGDMWSILTRGGVLLNAPPPETVDEWVEAVRATEPRTRILVGPPLMHGTGFLSGMMALARGGAVITLTDRSFQPIEALETAKRWQPDTFVIVGDAFARPLLRAVEESGDSAALASLRAMLSSGTMWSPEVKAGLLKHNPMMVLADAFSSSEALGMGTSFTTAADVGKPTRFIGDEDTLVLGEDMQPVAPGSGAIGKVARGGLLPRGYYKDEEKTARTFADIGGKRYCMAGDQATVEADGSITLLGRGSHCINTGGEKVFPEEVEEALKTHPLVEDALVFGVADEKWGQAVTAVVEASGAEPGELIAYARGQLAAYKCPKRVVIVAKVPRAPNGKADYAGAKALASELEPA